MSVATRVATRASGTTTNQSQRRAPYPSNNGRATLQTASSSTSTPNHAARRAPGGPPVGFRVDRIVRNGVPTEVLTIEDTPPPGGPLAGPSGTGSAYASSSRYDSHHSNHEPAPKKRKSDAAHISDQPYASSSSHRGPPGLPNGNGNDYGGYEVGANGNGANGTRKNKRKLDARDGYSTNGRDRESGSARDSAQRQPANQLPINDKEGHFIVRVGDLLDHKYKIMSPLGQGTFGKVVHAKNLNARDGANPNVAVKIIRAVQKYRDASRVEIKVLTLLQQHDKENKYKCIHLLEVFDWKNHVCLVTELLSASVFDFLKENQYQPFPFSQIQHFARQLLSSVEFLQSLRLVHTDLKPENILLEDARFDVFPVGSSKHKTRKVLRNSNIRLIDFGSATFENEYHATVVSTRHYRAPEIILGMGWSYPCDVWSIGCILIEFYTGEALFQTHENVEHLAMMQNVFGPMPQSFVQEAVAATAPTHSDWFCRDDAAAALPRRTVPKKLNFPIASTTKQSKKFVAQMKSLKQIINPDGITPQRFLNLLEKLLQWDPSQRISVKQALNHPFFQLKITDEATSENR